MREREPKGTTAQHGRSRSSWRKCLPAFLDMRAQKHKHTRTYHNIQIKTPQHLMPRNQQPTRHTLRNARSQATTMHAQTPKQKKNAPTPPQTTTPREDESTNRMWGSLSWICAKAPAPTHPPIHTHNQMQLVTNKKSNYSPQFFVSVCLTCHLNSETHRTACTMTQKR